jgi:membrane protease YdiL (CAAX protease family)
MVTFMGDFCLRVSDPRLALAVGLNMVAAGVAEEIAFRGLVLYALVPLWGDSAPGIMRSILISALLFGATYILRIAVGKPVPQAMLLVTSAFLSDIYYGAYVLYGNNIWPAAAMHGLLNAVISVRAVSTPDFEETVLGYVLIIVLSLPLVLCGVYLARRVSPRSFVPDAA